MNPYTSGQRKFNLMVKFQINNKQYQTPEGWPDVTFEKFLLGLTDLEPKRPKSLRKFLEEHAKAVGEIDESITGDARQTKAVELFEERWEAIPPKEKVKIHKFMSITVGFWCNLESALIREFMNLDQLEQTFWTIEYELNPENAEIKEDWTGFKIDKIEYLPPSKHMEDSTVVEFAESAQFQENMKDVENGNWLAMQDVMVVLCRPVGEVYEYDKIKHEARKELFKQVTMNHVINLAFFLLRLNKTLKHNLLIYTLAAELEQKKQGISVTATDGTT